MSAGPPREPDIRAVRPVEDGVDLDLVLSPDLAPFQGHFPQAAVLPGVAQIHWAVTFAHRHLALTGGTAPLFQVKFRRIIVPNTAITLALRRDRVKNRLTFEYRAGDELMSSGAVMLTEES